MTLRAWICLLGFANFFLLAGCLSSFAASSSDGGGSLLLYLFGVGAIGGGAVKGGVAAARELKKVRTLRELMKKVGVSAEQTPSEHDANVTVFAPPTAPPSEEMLIQAFVHLPHMVSEARAI